MARTRTSFTKGNTFGFKLGQSGNPSGRKPVIDDIHALARQHAPAAIDALVKALADPDRAIPAAVALLDRGFGKPPVAVFAQLNGSLIVGGIDRPPRETLEQWLARRRRELALLDGPQPEHAQPPNGEVAAQEERPQARVVERPGAADSAGPPPMRSKTPAEEDWLRQRRKRLGIEPDDTPPNPTLKR